MSDDRLDPKIFEYVNNILSVQTALEELEINRFYKFRILMADNTSDTWILLNTLKGKELWRSHRNWNEFIGFYMNVRNAMYDAVEISMGLNAGNE